MKRVWMVWGAALLVGLWAVVAAAWAAEDLAISFEDTTEQSGIVWEVLPKDPGVVKPGVAYMGWEFDVFLFDADGDGHADIVSPSHHANERQPGGLWLGRGDGTFGPNTMDKQPIVDEAGKPAPIAAAYGVGVDLDGDGRLDFVCVEHWGYYLSRGVEGTGEGRVVKFTAYKSGGWRTWVLGDFNRDGKLDVARNAELLLGSGKGTHPNQWKQQAQTTAEFKKWADTTQYGVLHQAVGADFDRDGDVDLLVSPSLLGKGRTEPRPRLLLYINDGAGGFTECAEKMGIVGGPPQGAIVAADLNNDGYFDIVATGRGNGTDDLKRRIVLYVNEGGKKFTAKDPAASGLQIADTADYNITYSSGLAVDFDNDGLLDVVIGDALSGYRVFRNLGDFRFQAVAVLRPGARMARPASADINEDGLMDLIVNEGRRGLTIYTNRSKNANGWIELAVRGPEGNLSGVGSLVEVFRPGKFGDRSALLAMQHVCAENDNHVPLAPHFGLGKEPAADVRVTFPGGKTAEARGVKANTRIFADFETGKVAEKK